MPVRIVPDAFKSENGIQLTQLREMTENFQNHPGGGRNPVGLDQPTTHFAWFPVKNILDLLVVNKVCSAGDTIGQVMSSRKAALKVHFAQHVHPDDCPRRDSEFIGRNTVVMVVTLFEDNQWKDCISDDLNNPSFVETTGFDEDVVDPNEGLDKTNLCPPQCLSPGLV